MVKPKQCSSARLWGFYKRGILNFLSGNVLMLEHLHKVIIGIQSDSTVSMASHTSEQRVGSE